MTPAKCADLRHGHEVQLDIESLDGDTKFRPLLKGARYEEGCRNCNMTIFFFEGAQHVYSVMFVLTVP